MIVLYILAAVIGAILGILLLNVLFLGALSLFVKNKDYDEVNGFYRAVFSFYLKLAAFFCRIKIEVSGREKIKPELGRFLLVGNHRSAYDPFVVLIGLKVKDLAFISKPENFKVPLFGKIARKSLHVAIDRENPRNAIKTINRTADFIERGVISYGVFPEGTRSKGNSMLPFHDGVFKIALKSGAPVVVLAIRGTEKVHKNAPWKKTVVHLDVLEVIDAKKVQSMTSHEIAAAVRDKLSAATDGK